MTLLLPTRRTLTTFMKAVYTRIAGEAIQVAPRQGREYGPVDHPESRRCIIDLGHEPLYRLVEKLAAGEIVLPDIQRDYVWRGTQIPRLLDSLNKEWPVGSILLWDTSLKIPTKPVAIVQGRPAGSKPSILLDGQQRLSTLARVMAPDAVPEGEKSPDIRFNPETNEFRTANAVNKRDHAWISVSEMLQQGAQFRELVKPLGLEQEQEDAWTDVLSRVASRIRGYMLPVQTVHVTTTR